MNFNAVRAPLSIERTIFIRLGVNRYIISTIIANNNNNNNNNNFMIVINHEFMLVSLLGGRSQMIINSGFCVIL